MTLTSVEREVNFKNAIWEILIQQWKEQKFCDLIVYLKDGEIEVHAWLMFGLCPKLIETSSIARNPVHYCLHLKQFKMESFKRVASYIYEGDIFLDSTDVMQSTILKELLDLASFLQMTELEYLCQKYSTIALNTNADAEPVAEHNDAVGKTDLNNITTCQKTKPQQAGTKMLLKKIQNFSKNTCGPIVKSVYNTRSRSSPVKQSKQIATEQDGVDEDSVSPLAIEAPPLTTNSNDALVTDNAGCNNLDICLSLVKEEVEEEPSESSIIPSSQSIHAKRRKRKRRRHDSDSSDDAYFCHICGMKFSKKKDLSQHKQAEHLWKCSSCGLELYTEMELADHYTNEHKNDMIIKHDTVEPKYKCFTCNAHFVTSHERSLHEKDNHDIEIYTCDICGIQYNHKYHLTRHKRSKHFHNNHLKCRLCDWDGFNTETQLRVHFKNTHSEEKPFKCDFPGCKFAGKRFDSVVKHREIHDPLYNYSCEKCGKSFSQSSGLSSHYKACYHKQQYLCDICGKPFNHFQSMKSHRRSQHFGEKPYTCDFCGKKFTDQRNLKRHKRIHENAFPYCCECCGKCYRHSNSLKAHMKKHENGNEHSDGLTRKEADVLIFQTLSWESSEKAMNNVLQVNV